MQTEIEIAAKDVQPGDVLPRFTATDKPSLVTREIVRIPIGEWCGVIMEAERKIVVLREEQPCKPKQ